MTIVLGDPVVIGRDLEADPSHPSVGAVPVASAAVSRRHLSIARRDGAVWVRDLGSHNGTTQSETARSSGRCASMRRSICASGDEVSLVVRPADELAGAVAIEVAGARYVAPLGPALLGIGRWRLECVRTPGVEDWIELVTDDAPPAFAGGLRLASRVTLLAGDAFAAESGGTDRDSIRER